MTGYPDGDGLCDWCRVPLTSLNHMINPVSLSGRWEYVCSDCISKFLDNVTAHGYELAQKLLDKRRASG